MIAIAFFSGLFLGGMLVAAATAIALCAREEPGR